MAPSIIGEDLSVTGNIVSKGAVQVDGEIQGDVHCTSLVIGEKARVNGGLVAEEVEVCGNVTGSIRATRVTLKASSHVEGDIHHQTISIEQGAFFEGKSRRSENPTDVKGDAPGRPPKNQGSSPNQGNGSPPAKAEDEGKPPQAAE